MKEDHDGLGVYSRCTNLKPLTFLKHDNIIFSRLVGHQGSTVITKKVKIISQYTNNTKNGQRTETIRQEFHCAGALDLCSWQIK